MSRVPLVVFSFVTQVIHKNKTDRLTNKKKSPTNWIFFAKCSRSKKKNIYIKL